MLLNSDWSTEACDFTKPVGRTKTKTQIRKSLMKSWKQFGSKLYVHVGSHHSWWEPDWEKIFLEPLNKWYRCWHISPVNIKQRLPADERRYKVSVLPEDIDDLCDLHLPTSTDSFSSAALSKKVISPWIQKNVFLFDLTNLSEWIL